MRPPGKPGIYRSITAMVAIPVGGSGGQVGPFRWRRQGAHAVRSDSGFETGVHGSHGIAPISMTRGREFATAVTSLELHSRRPAGTFGILQQARQLESQVHWRSGSQSLLRCIQHWSLSERLPMTRVYSPQRKGMRCAGSGGQRPPLRCHAHPKEDSRPLYAI